MHGGKRNGAGRKPGSINKRTAALRAINEEALLGGVIPLEVMLKNMRFCHDEAEKLLSDIRRLLQDKQAVEALAAYQEMTDVKKTAQMGAV